MDREFATWCDVCEGWPAYWDEGGGLYICPSCQKDINKPRPDWAQVACGLALDLGMEKQAHEGTRRDTRQYLTHWDRKSPEYLVGKSVKAYIPANRWAVKEECLWVKIDTVVPGTQKVSGILLHNPVYVPYRRGDRVDIELDQIDLVEPNKPPDWLSTPDLN